MRMRPKDMVRIVRWTTIFILKIILIVAGVLLVAYGIIDLLRIFQTMHLDVVIDFVMIGTGLLVIEFGRRLKP